MGPGLLSALLFAFSKVVRLERSCSNALIPSFLKKSVLSEFMDLTSRAVALLGTLGRSGKLLVYRNPYLWTEVKVLKLAGSWLRLSAASWCLGVLKGCAHISQRWVTSDAQITVDSYWLRHGRGAVHHWQIRKSDQIKEIIKAQYQLGIRSESLLGHRSAPSGMVGWWCLVPLTAVTLPLMYQEPLQTQHCSL